MPLRRHRGCRAREPEWQSRAPPGAADRLAALQV